MSRTTPCTLLAKLIVNHKPSHFRVENPIASVTLRVPIVLRRNGFKVAIRHPPREHGPAHVHVLSGEGECEFWISTQEVTVKAIHAMRVTAVRDALQIVADNLDFLLAEWTRLHGPKGSKGK